MPWPVLVALDLETTGLDPEKDQVIEVGAVRFEHGRESGHYQCLVNPGRPVPLRVQRLTGITANALEGAASMQEAWDGLLAFCAGLPVVAYHADFDLAFARDWLRRTGRPPTWSQTVDCLELARLALPALGDYRLPAVARHLGLTPARHRAVDDARTCGQAFVALSARLELLPTGALQEILAIMGGRPWPLRPWVEQARARSRPAAFVARASREGGMREEPGDRPCRAVDPDLVSAYLLPGSPLARKFPRFEHRPQQVHMLQVVAETFNDGRVALVEAGTGTGKSLAYLLPAVCWAVANDAPVVLSTHTINLQEQLVEKDIPLLRHGLELPFRVAVLKGRGNYLCLHKWAELRRAGPMLLDEEEARWQARIVAWLAVSDTGDKAELNLPPRGEELWSLVDSDSDYCRGTDCLYRETCYVQAARRAAAQAHLVVVNHALLISDAVAGNLVLPAYRHLVLDEAHHLEDVATEHMTEETGLHAFVRVLDALGSPAGGALGQVHRFLARAGGAPAAAACGPVQQQLAEVRVRAGNLFSQLGAMVDRQQPGGEAGYPASRRLRPAVEDGEEWSLCRERALLLEQAVAGLEGSMERLRKCAEGGEGELGATLAYVERLLLALQRLTHPVSLLLHGDEEAYVYWLELRKPGVVLRVAPLAVGPLLYRQLFRRLRGVVLTSATLGIAGNFGYFCERVGLEAVAGDLILESIGSPFCYHRQALVAVPSGFPKPQEHHTGDYARAVEAFLGRLLPVTRGRTLVLFTSHRLMREVYFRLRDVMEAQDICLLAQGIDGSRSRLLEEFRTAERTALLGSVSFWEGVDVPGEALSCVVMVRLPFTTPASPVFAARTEALERRGLSAFRRLALPQAVLRFRQGFGRLIRTGQDRGVVIVLDPRVSSSSSRYGQAFLSSLPGPQLVEAPEQEVLAAVESWLEAGVLPG